MEIDVLAYGLPCPERQLAESISYLKAIRISVSFPKSDASRLLDWLTDDFDKNTPLMRREDSLPSLTIDSLNQFQGNQVNNHGIYQHQVDFNSDLYGHEIDDSYLYVE